LEINAMMHDFRNIARRHGAVPSLALALIMALSLLGAAAPASAAQAARPTLEVRAPRQVAVGQVIELTLIARDVADVAGYETMLLFDTGVAEFAGLHQRDNDLRRFGRDVGPLAAEQLPNGSAIGLYSCAVSSCVERRGPRQGRGGRGAVRLATVDIIAHQPGALEIKLDATKFVDAAGRPVDVALRDQVIVVQVGPAGARHPAPASAWRLASAAPAAPPAPLDLTGDGLVSHADAMEAALEWTLARQRGAPCGPGIDATRDVNRDGCVDVADIQQIAASYSPDGAAPAPAAPQQPGLAPQASLAAGPATFVVNSAGDQVDSKIGDGICKTSAGTCTLRAAIYEANSHAGPDTIAFNIPGTGVQTIQIGSSRLPSLSDASGGTTIDGYTQPGSAPNTDPLVSNAVLKIQIAGNGESGIDGFTITSAGNTIRGVAVYNFKRGYHIYGSGAHDNVVVGDFIGTNAAATFKAPTVVTDAHGLHIEQGAARNRVGGTAPADRNVISGNSRSGIGLWHEQTDGSILQNNLIGLDPTGTVRLGNLWHGIDMNFGVAYSIVGGTGPGERNVVSGNDRQGIEVSHTAGTTQNQIVGNYVGTNVTGTRAPSATNNGGFGIQVKDRALNNVVRDNVVGNNRSGGIRIDEYGNCCVAGNQFSNNRVGISLDGTAIPNGFWGIKITAGKSTIGPGNIIANNPTGIQVDDDASDGNTITRNSIYGNTALGIDLGPLGTVNPNDAGDADAGPNQQLNFPVLATATATQVTGSACLTCTVEIFKADSPAGEYGEGQAFVGSAAVGPDGSFSAAVSGLKDGDTVTATATDAAGNTSEFAANIAVGGGTPPPPPTGIALPGRFEAEDYRAGGEGVGYHDTTAGNTGGVYRTDNVDIGDTCTDGSPCYFVGWIAAGEWLAYDVNVATAGSYTISIRVATPNTSRKMHVEIDGVNVSGALTLPVTGSYQTWANLNTAPIQLSAGNHTLRLVADSASFNINYVTVSQ
jgi:CSLREA domain-containing protein